jgi:hypothetical protein
LVFLVALCWGVIHGLLRLRGVTFAGDKASVDASALFFGQPLYGDPTRGYASSVYTPLLPVLGAALDHLRFWRSWTPLVTFVSSLAMVGVLARLAYVGGRPRFVRMLEAAGVGAILYWLVGELSPGYFWNDRPDQLSWTLGILGLVALQRATRSNVAAVGVVVLLSAAFWAKQTGLVASGACLVVLVVEAWSGRIGWARVGSLVAGFVALNGLLVFIVNELTGGWFVRIAFEWPMRQPCCEFSPRFPTYLKGFVVEFSVRFFFGLLFLGALAVALSVVVSQDRRAWRAEWRPAFAFAVFSVLALGAALVTRHRIGAAPSHELGLAWGLVLLMALAYRYLRRSSLGTAMLVVLIGLLLAGTQLVTSRQLYGSNQDGYLKVNGLRPRPDWTAAPRALVSFARHHIVFDPNDGDISAPYAHEAFPTWIDLSGFMYVGQMPAYLARLVIERRFDVAYPYSATEVGHPLSSGNGRYEANYLWKINRAILLEYRPAPGVPTGGRVPISGPDPAPWLSRCFGPYSIHGIALVQHVGGGFWCPGRSTITLRETPALFTDLRTNTDDIDGTVSVTLARAGSFRVALERGDHVIWQRTKETRQKPETFSVQVPRMPDTELSLGATRNSQASFDLSKVHKYQP